MEDFTVTTRTADHFRGSSCSPLFYVLAKDEDQFNVWCDVTGIIPDKEAKCILSVEEVRELPFGSRVIKLVSYNLRRDFARVEAALDRIEAAVTLALPVNNFVEIVPPLNKTS